MITSNSTKTISTSRWPKITCRLHYLAELTFHYDVFLLVLSVQVFTWTNIINFLFSVERTSCCGSKLFHIHSSKFLLHYNFFLIMAWTRNELSFFHAQELWLSLSLWVKPMISLVIWVVFSYRRVDIVKTCRFRFLCAISKLICKSFNCWSKKLEWEWFLLDLERTLVDIILSRSWVFSLEIALISFSGGFV